MAVPLLTVADAPSPIVNPLIDLSAALWQPVGTDPTAGGVVGRLVQLAPCAGSFDIWGVVVTSADTITVQVWRVSMQEVEDPSRALARNLLDGHRLGFCENATRDLGGTPNNLALTAAATAPKQFILPTATGIVNSLRTGGTDVFVGPKQTFAARGASHVIISVQTVSAARQMGVLLQSY